MTLLNNLSIKSKLTLILLFPVLGLLVFASLQSYEYYEKYTSMQKIKTLTFLSQKISRLVHETQKERGMTAGYIGSKGKKFKDKLPEQRELSNKNFKIFKEFSQNIDFNNYPSVFEKNIKSTIEKFEGLNNIRPKVDSLQIPVGEAIGYYTQMNTLILSNVKLISKLSSDAIISREITSYANFLLSKERAGIERAVGANTLGRGDFGNGMKTKLINLINAQNVYMNNYLDLASNESIHFYEKTMVGNDINEVNRIRVNMFNGTFTDKPEYWFAQITSKINKLKTVDNKLSEMLIKNVNKIEKSVFNGLIFTLIGSILALLIALFFGIGISKKLTKTMNDFTDGLNNFFDFLNYKIHDVNLLENNDKDEFGKMATKINENINKAKENIKQDRALIDETINISNRINKGCLDGEINATSSNPALNELKDILNNTMYSLNNTLANISEVLTSYTKLDYRPIVDKNDMEGVIEKLINGINELGETITQDLISSKRNGLILQNSANTLTDNVENLTTSSNEAAASLEETAAALEEITSTIISNSDNVTQMASYAAKVTNSANNGEKLATDTMNSMDELNTQVTSINEAITVIDQIAFQTNILSLNAAVEAATAGEAGKGFAVVAQEVRNLASRSAEAAKEIKNIVETATLKANMGKDITQNMLNGYIELNKDIDKTLELIKDVDIASKEQQSGIEQINDAVTRLDQQTQTNAAAALETNDIAVSTQQLSQNILEKADKKQFRGKEEVIDRRAKYKDLDYSKNEKRRVEKILKNNNNNFSNEICIGNELKNECKKEELKTANKKVFTSDKNSDEWESF